MRRSLTRVRYEGKGQEHAQNVVSSNDSPMGADKDAHYMECHSDPLKVGIVDEVA